MDSVLTQMSELDHARTRRRFGRRQEQSRTDGAGRPGERGQVGPHIKTHKSLYFTAMQLEHGASGITVAKLGEAEVMAGGGVDDVLLAYPPIGEVKLKRLAGLLEQTRGSSPSIAWKQPRDSRGSPVAWRRASRCTSMSTRGSAGWACPREDPPCDSPRPSHASTVWR